jgi:putative colanic acid biosynthesis acetyltransferase WcaB
MLISFNDLFVLVKHELLLNKGIRLRTVIVLFRCASYYHYGKNILKYLFWPITIIYKIYSEFLLGIELPSETRVGAGLRIFHGVGLVVHKDVKIGMNCTLRQGVTIGNKGEGSQSTQLPLVRNNVEFGAASIVIGDIEIGDNVIIGAGCVVTNDVPSNSIAIGASARIYNRKSKSEYEAID